MTNHELTLVWPEFYSWLVIGDYEVYVGDVVEDDDEKYICDQIYCEEAFL